MVPARGTRTVQRERCSANSGDCDDGASQGAACAVFYSAPHGSLLCTPAATLNISGTRALRARCWQCPGVCVDHAQLQCCWAGPCVGIYISAARSQQQWHLVKLCKFGRHSVEKQTGARDS